MKSKQRRIMREQLDVTFSRLKEMKQLQPPVKGWLRSVREALGMSGVQLGKRLGVSQPRVVQLEKDELSGAVTLKTMRQTAAALDCVFVYAVVPRVSLAETVQQQARKVVERQLSRTSHTMLLENQQLSEEEQQRMFEEKVFELSRDLPARFWSE